MTCDDEKDKDASFTAGKKVALSRFEKWPPPKPVLLSFFLSFFLSSSSSSSYGVAERQTDRDRETERDVEENGVTKFDWIGCFSSRFSHTLSSISHYDFQKLLAAPVVVTSSGVTFESARRKRNQNAR